ncbi:MAG: hypothetical protein U0822_00695 [Anaerolineae bacterium]
MSSLTPRLVVLALCVGVVLGLAYLVWPTANGAVTEASVGSMGGGEASAVGPLSVAAKPAEQSTAVPLPPTIRPANPANPAQIATIPPRPPAPGGNPPGAAPIATPGVPPGGRPGVPPTLPPAAPQGAQPVATVPPRGGQPPTPVGTVGAAPAGQQPPAPTARPGTVGPQPGTPTAVSGGVPLRTLSGTVTGKTEQSIEIEIADRGTITVEPRPQTEIRRDGVKTTLDAIEVGDTASVSINEENFPLAIIATSPPEATGTNPLWYVLLGVVMLGVTLMLDSDLRRKFMAALLEP